MINWVQNGPGGDHILINKLQLPMLPEVLKKFLMVFMEWWIYREINFEAESVLWDSNGLIFANVKTVCTKSIESGCYHYTLWSSQMKNIVIPENGIIIILFCSIQKGYQGCGGFFGLEHLEW